MTIIQPKKTKGGLWGSYMVIGLMIVVAAAALNVILYNQTVNLQHLIKTQTQTVEKLGVANEELKNGLYQTLDAQNLQTLVAERGFIKVTTPRYLSSR